MFKVSLVEKLNITLNFGGDKKIEVGSGQDSRSALVMTSPLASKAIDLSQDKPPLNFPKKVTKRVN